MQRHVAPERMLTRCEVSNWCCQWCHGFADKTTRRQAKRRERQAWKKAVRHNLYAE